MHRQPQQGASQLQGEHCFNSNQQLLAANKLIIIFRGASSKSFCASIQIMEKKHLMFSLINSLPVWWRAIVLSQIQISGTSLPDPCPLKETVGTFFDKDLIKMKRVNFYHPAKCKLGGSKKSKG